MGSGRSNGENFPFQEKKLSLIATNGLSTLVGDPGADDKRLVSSPRGLEIVSGQQDGPDKPYSPSAESRVRATSVLSRSPSTPRSRQPALANLKASSIAKENGRLSTSLGSQGPLDLEELKVGLDSPIRIQGQLSRSNSLRSRLARGDTNIQKTKRQQRFQKKGLKRMFFMLAFLAIYFLFDWWVLSRLRDLPSTSDDSLEVPTLLQGEWTRFPKGERPPGVMYDRLLGLAAHALAEGELKREPKDLWEEPYAKASAWKPCADEKVENVKSSFGVHNTTGYIMVSANGGLNQQRVAICNAVGVARLLNATLVIPQFLYSNVWKDSSQFGDIYQEDFFINYLKDDLTIVKELPVEFHSLDLEAIGSFVSDMDVMKEAKPSFYVTYVLPILLRNRVVHFHGFGNRLSFDPVPFDIQRLRCRCNFHALKFVPKIRRTGALLIDRMREQSNKWGPMQEGLEFQGDGDRAISRLKSLHLLVDTPSTGNHSSGLENITQHSKNRAFKYLGLHLRFEIDMAAYSMCEFGGGESERRELEAYREAHFPTLTMYKKNGKLLSAAQLRQEGNCPLTPEEAVLMLVALGFRRGTRIYLAGAHIYGGQSRMVALTSLYPNLVTKEDLLSPKELKPFINKSSQLAALDFIGCAAANIFAMTDSGSQLSSLVSGYRIYYGGGLLPTVRPNKRRLAGIFSQNKSIEWEEFRDRVRKTVKESKKVQKRPTARSVYRLPRCPECMCQIGANDTKIAQ